MALKQERNYGIDLLRMVAMFMVAVLHVLGQGGVLKNSPVYSGQYLIGWFLEFAALTSVNLYAMISGYVGVKSKCRVSNLVVLWLQVFFYSFGIAAVCAIIEPAFCSGADLVGFAFPVIMKKYWYFSAYFCLFLFMPLLNAGINAVSKRTLRLVILAMALFFSVAASAAKEASKDPFLLVSGYSGLWLMILYAVGGYIGKYGLWESVPKPALIGIFFGCAAVSLGLRLTIREISKAVSGAAYSVKFVATFISPLVLLGSVALLLFFARLQCGDFSKKLIAFFAPAAFGVYIIHVHPLIWDHLMLDRFAFIAEYSPLVFLGAVLLCAFGIYLVCSLIDLARIQIFKLLKIKQRCQALEEKLFKEKEKIGGR